MGYIKNIAHSKQRGGYSKMAFSALKFIFNGIPSEMHSLNISSDDSGESDTDMPGDVELVTEKLFRRTDEFLYGASIIAPLSFPVKFTTDNEELTSLDLQLIGKWLFGKKQYQTLQIIQPDMQDIFYDCFLLEPKIFRVGNIIRGVSCIVRNKSAWGFTSKKTFTYNYPGGAFNETIIHNNSSDDSGYTNPDLKITFDNFGGDFTWTNITDNNRVSSLTSMSANEVVTIKNGLQIITSSTGLKRLSNFNKNFFRLLSGKNEILLNGNVVEFELSYPLAKKIGG